MARTPKPVRKRRRKLRMVLKAIDPKWPGRFPKPRPPIVIHTACLCYQATAEEASLDGDRAGISPVCPIHGTPRNAAILAAAADAEARYSGLFEALAQVDTFVPPAMLVRRHAGGKPLTELVSEGRDRLEDEDGPHS